MAGSVKVGLGEMIAGRTLVMFDDVEHLDDKGLPQAGLEELARVLKGHALALTLAAKRLNSDGGAVLARHLEQYRRGLQTGRAIALPVCK